VAHGDGSESAVRTFAYFLKPAPMENVWEVDKTPLEVGCFIPRVYDSLGNIHVNEAIPVGMDAQALWVCGYIPGGALSGRVISPPVFPQP
jgi:hypothetical protein